MKVDALLETTLPLPLLHQGKVRDVYEVGPDELLMVASDRVSAFDVVMSRPVPRKGEVLTQLTAWWLDQLRVDHHLLAVDPDLIERRHPELGESRATWARRAMLVRRAAPMPVECVVRGYLSGSAWKQTFPREHEDSKRFPARTPDPTPQPSAPGARSLRPARPLPFACASSSLPRGLGASGLHAPSLLPVRAAPPSGMPRSAPCTPRA